MKKLPEAERIHGMASSLGGDHRQTKVGLQYTDHTGQWYELTMSLEDALYFASMVRHNARERGLNIPDVPLAPPPSGWLK